MTPTSSGFRVVPKRDRRPDLAWHIAHCWPRTFGARATVSDVALRWQVEPSTCEQLLVELTERRVLVARPDGSYELART